MDGKQQMEGQGSRSSKSKKPSGWIPVLWAVGCFILAAIGFWMGYIFISGHLTIFAVIVILYSFFMIGVAIHQIKKATALAKKKRQGGQEA